jgi:uncharacterized UBP type Zn finger protein
MEEPFYNIQLVVKNVYNLEKSMENMIKPENIVDFKCEACEQRADIQRRAMLN